MARNSTQVLINATDSLKSELENWVEASSVDTVLRSGSFECRGEGFLVDGFPCEAPAKLNQPLKPDENPGLVSVPNYKDSRKWWKVNAILRQAGLEHSREHIILEQRLNRAYHEAKTRGEGEIDNTPVLQASKPEVEGLLELPGLMMCKLRLKTGTPRPEDGYVRFEWCWREERMDEILAPSSSTVGCVKSHHDNEQTR
ncbi:hypothetical protein OPQ81_006729 [Rhizoctonia solani]|nr:hypothetical protein OPQ81_006729 [Rhizoctonia solani]